MSEHEDLLEKISDLEDKLDDIIDAIDNVQTIVLPLLKGREVSFNSNVSRPPYHYASSGVVTEITPDNRVLVLQKNGETISVDPCYLKAIT